jgi:hypothetical protein
MAREFIRSECRALRLVSCQNILEYFPTVFTILGCHIKYERGDMHLNCVKMISLRNKLLCLLDASECENFPVKRWD